MSTDDATAHLVALATEVVIAYNRGLDPGDTMAELHACLQTEYGVPLDDKITMYLRAAAAAQKCPSRRITLR